MKSAKELLSFDHFNENAFARRAPQPIVISQKHLKILEGIVKNHANTGIKLPNREDLRQIYHSFINAHQIGRLHTEFDSFKRTRQLAWALTYSEGGVSRIVDTPQLIDALELIDDRFRISALLGVFNTLLQAWDTSNAGILRTFVKKHLTNYKRISEIGSETENKFVVVLRGKRCNSVCDDAAAFAGKVIGGLVNPRIARLYAQLSLFWCCCRGVYCTQSQRQSGDCCRCHQICRETQ